MTAPKLHVAVLMGGQSGERDVSFSSGMQVHKALDRAQYRVTAVDAAPNPLELDSLSRPKLPHEVALSADLIPFDKFLTMCQGKDRPDICFLALHGKYGEDGSIQGMLD